MQTPDTNTPADEGEVRASADFLWGLDLSVRATNVLFRMNICSYAELSCLDETTLGRQRNCGRKTIVEIMRLVRSLQRDVPPRPRLACHFLAPIESLGLAEHATAALKQIDIHTTAALAAAPHEELSSSYGLREAREILWEFFLKSDDAQSILNDTNPIEYIRLSVRAKKAVLNLGATTVGGVARLKNEELLALPNIGRRSIYEIHTKVLHYFVNRDSEETREIPDDPKAFVEMLVDELPRHLKDVLTRRFGFWNRRPETLQDIGDSRGCTRERIRQLESKALSDLNWPGNVKLVQRFLDRLAKLHFEPAIQTGLGVATEDELRSLFLSLFKDSEEGLSVEALFSTAFLNEKSIYDACYLTVQDGLYSSNDTLRQQYIDSVKIVEEHLIRVNKPIPLSELITIVANSGPRFGEIGEEVLSRFLRIAPSLSTAPDGFIGLADWSYMRPKTVHGMIVRSLVDLGKPAHFTQIAMHVNAKFSSTAPISARYVHARLVYDQATFVWQSNGVYGLSAWGLKKAPYVKDRLVEILKSAGQPMSLRQLVPKVLETCHCNEKTPAAILEMHRDLFVRLDKGVYGLREWTTT